MVNLIPNEGTRSASAMLSSLSYHVRILCEQEITRCTHTSQGNGATEHFYASNVVGNKLVDMILAETEEDDGPLRPLR
jgi:hypothetical protein